MKIAMFQIDKIEVLVNKNVNYKSFGLNEWTFACEQMSMNELAFR